MTVVMVLPDEVVDELGIDVDNITIDVNDEDEEEQPADDPFSVSAYEVRKEALRAALVHTRDTTAAGLIADAEVIYQFLVKDLNFDKD